MITKKLRIVFGMMFVMLLAACRDIPVVEPESQQGDPIKNNIINANRLISQSEAQQIDAYIARRSWQVQRLTGGICVMETAYEGPQQRRKLEYDDTVSLTYSVESIGGNIIYDQMCDTVVVGRMKPNRGIDAVLRTLSDGSSAVVILPSEQAFGVVGDGNRIGTRMVLIYRLKAKKLIKQQYS